ncbi:DDE-type integrase/transposase/recombinase [Nocardia fluminea]|uniref:DDE-type integrase/transposase/recombinase n=1 Tax=Nocardia fluminea TaxID=134984 RepID=UPI0034240B3F
MVIISTRYPLEVREKALRLALDHLDEYPAAYAAVQAIGPMVDVHPESLRQWILKAQVSPGKPVAAAKGRATRARAVASGEPGPEAGQRDPEVGVGSFRAGTRPATPLIVGFIDQYRQVHGVESICRVLIEQGIQIAPRTYRKARFRPPSARDVFDANLEHALRGLADTPSKYMGGERRTLSASARTLGRRFAPPTGVMRDLGMNGVVRGRRHRTTILSKDGIRAGDRLNRDFGAQVPNLVWVADFTYVSTWTGWAYVAFVFDVFSRSIVGWTVSSTKTTALVSKALNMAIWRRDHCGHSIEPGLIHHSDVGSR